MQKKNLLKCLLIGVVSSVGTLADMTVDKSNGILTITSDISGTVIAKVIGPNDEVVVDSTYEGNSFSWSPSGVAGAYRYDVRVISASQKTDAAQSDNSVNSVERTSVVTQSDYAGGSVEVKNAQITIEEKE